MKEYKYTVRVSCMTFNQAPYIEDALNGFCKQETSFPFVCTIVDDASTDGEPMIIQHYLDENFDLNNSIIRREETPDYSMVFTRHIKNKNCFFAVYFLKYNHYQKKKNKLEYLTEWHNNSKYYAICEGDDYWSDPNKLSIQVAALESNPDVGLCYAQATVYNESINAYTNEIKGKKFETLEQQLLCNHIPTLTVCMRTDLDIDYLFEKKKWEGSEKWKMGDYPRWLWFCMHSKVLFLESVVGVYRVSANSASRPKSVSQQEAFIRSTFDIRMHFANMAGVGRDIIYAINNDYKKDLSFLYIDNGDYQKGVLTAKELPLIDRINIYFYILKRKIKKLL